MYLVLKLYILVFKGILMDDWCDLFFLHVLSML